MEKNINFISDNYSIEGLLEQNSLTKGAIITHPHSLYGGNMYNSVVEAALNSYKKVGFTVLRFNFRGVGDSQGSFDEGIGEQNDVKAALNYLEEIGIQEVDLVGYSFGAWVNAMLTTREKHDFHRVVLISPPVNFVNFETVGNIDRLEMAIVGDKDDIAPPRMVEEAIPSWNSQAELKVVDGADHFFSGRLSRLEEILSSLFE